MKKVMICMKNNLNFKWGVKDVVLQTEKLIKDHTAFVDDLVKTPIENQTFESIVKPLAYQEAQFSNISRNVCFFQNVSGEKDLRDASSKAEKDISNYSIDLYTREDLFKVLDNVMKTEKNLDELDQRYLEYAIREFKRNGLGCPDKIRDEIKKIKKQITSNEVDFCQNLINANPEFKFTKEQLAGCEEDWLSQLKKEDDNFFVNLKYPHRSHILKNCSVPETRKKIDDEYHLMIPGNPKIYEETVQLRNKFSTLLGFNNFPEYHLDVRMAKKPENVKNFLLDLTQKLVLRGQDELVLFQNLKKEELGLSELPTIESYDFYYYCNQRKKKELGLDDEKVKEYFPVQKVIDCTLEIFQKTFGLAFERVEKEENVWHEEVITYIVKDGQTDEFMGKFYMDLYPREGKYNHFCFCSLQSSCILESGEFQYPIGTILCNFQRGTAEKPALLRHDDVETFFHEFGHLMHHMCSKTKYMKFSGTKVERDFVETPSQMMENWTFNPELLKKVISSHYETGDPLPDEIIEQILKSRKLNKALLTLRQLFFGTFDFESYFHQKDASFDSQKLYNELRKKVSQIPSNPDTNGVNVFGHLMGGYECSYYSYLWSEVFSFDAFGEFEKIGLTSPKIFEEVGTRFRKVVLEQGGQKDGMVIMEEFLKRKPNNAAFLKSLGIEE